MLRLCKSLAKLIFYDKNKISVLEAELQLKIKNIESQAAKLSAYKESESMNAAFLTLKR